ncbi:MAG: transposase [Acidobacteria bacterium]|nr:transposase [Acidobacteriota bacterium]
MRKAAVTLSASSRRTVLESIRSVCEHQSWTLHAAHVLSTHVHVVVCSTAKPEAVMTKLKAYASRALGRTKCWSRHGSTGYIWDPRQLQSAVDYVVHGQGTSMARYPNP